MSPEIKYIFGIIALFLIIPGKYFYIKSIIKGETKPHIYTNIILGIIMGIGFLIQYNNGGGFSSIVLGISSLGEFFIIILALKYGRSKIIKSDKNILILALLCIPMYIFSNNQYLSLFFIIFIDTLSMIPTIRKTISSPKSENLISWKISTLKNFLSIFAITNLNIFTVLYPFTIIITNLVLIFTIVYFGKSKKSD